MDIVLALKFVSSQHLNGVLSGPQYIERIADLIDELVDQEDPRSLLKQLAEFIVKG